MLSFVWFEEPIRFDAVRHADFVRRKPARRLSLDVHLKCSPAPRPILDQVVLRQHVAEAI